ncbi:decarboxylase [Streptomyces sp. NPDC093252]|uniref:aspartate racemase/maleate isomerase family protein n=1 Tax=Streptomyces sp. NPDC093252 TaxID=3154980 RepID=UPI00344A29D0
MTALGFLHPGDAPADDYPRIEQLLGSDIRLDVVPTDLTDLTELEPGDRLAATAERLRLTGAEAVVWTGPAPADPGAARAQVRTLALAAGMPASATPLAFVNAAKELGATRVAVVATGPDPDTARFTDFLTAAGLRITRVATGTPDADLRALAAEALTPDAQALLLPDPALQTAAHIDALEARLARPVLTTSQTTVWEALRLTDRRVNSPGLGHLFTREPIVQV